MDNFDNIPESRVYSLRACVFSLMMHVAVFGCALWLYMRVGDSGARKNEPVFMIVSDVDGEAAAPSEPEQAEQAGQAGQEQAEVPLLALTSSQAAADAAVVPAEKTVSSVPDQGASLLSGLSGYTILNADGGKSQPDNNELFLDSRRLEANTSKPVVVASNASAPPEKAMDDNFAIFVQSIRDVYKKPEDVPAKEKLSVRIQYEILTDGTIGSVNIVRSSGSTAYDESVVRAFRSIASIGARPGMRRSVNVADFCLEN